MEHEGKGGTRRALSIKYSRVLPPHARSLVELLLVDQVRIAVLHLREQQRAHCAEHVSRYISWRCKKKLTSAGDTAPEENCTEK